MRDPRLFVDHNFLASLLLEFESDLDRDQIPFVLFQIGLLHGFREAARFDSDQREPADRPSQVRAQTTPLVMSWPEGAAADDSGRLSLHGDWPEQHEALARRARLPIAQEPQCAMSAGYTTGWLSETFGRSMLVREVSCVAAGDDACRFEAREASAWREEGQTAVLEILAKLSLEDFRSIALGKTAETEPPLARERGEREGDFDRDQSVVQIWGPVLFLPFTTPDEALGTVEMLTHDPGISEIRAVVVDLLDQSIVEPVAAAALEKTFETITSWQAECLLTGVSADSEATLRDLDSAQWVLRRDFSEAIPAAFQISDAQRYGL